MLVSIQEKEFFYNNSYSVMSKNNLFLKALSLPPLTVIPVMDNNAWVLTRMGKKDKVNSNNTNKFNFLVLFHLPNPAKYPQSQNQGAKSWKN